MIIIIILIHSAIYSKPTNSAQWIVIIFLYESESTMDQSEKKQSN